MRYIFSRIPKWGYKPYRTKHLSRHYYRFVFWHSKMSGDEFLVHNYKSIEEAKKIVITVFGRSRIKRFAELKNESSNY
jgi:hypothetical protein